MLIAQNTSDSGTTSKLQHDVNHQSSFFSNKYSSDSQENSLLKTIPGSIQKDLFNRAGNHGNLKAVPAPVEVFNIIGKEKSQFDYKPLKVFIEKGKANDNNYKDLNFQYRSDYKSHLNWTLLLGLICISLFLALKNNYQKFVNQVINALVNFQLAKKILQEKNILARRAYFMLNLNYLITFALFILIVFISIDYKITTRSYLDFLFIIIGLTGILSIKLAIIYINGYIFQMMPATSEYIHNIYLINKNLGIVLLPLIFATIFTPPVVSKILLITGFVLVSLSTLFKIMRGFQIIIKNKVLLFYSILYLCTLELLPLALGSKIIIALR